MMGTSESAVAKPRSTKKISVASVRAALIAAAKSVAGGVALTVFTIALVEFVCAIGVPIPRPSSLYLLAVTAAALLGGVRSGLISSLMVFAFSAYVTRQPNARHLLVFSGEQTTRLLLFGITAPAMAILIGVLRRRNDDLLRERVRREIAMEQAAGQAAVAARQAQLELEREHRIAATLQSALLSPLLTETAFAGLQIGCRYEAASREAEVGGDFYDVVTLTDATVAVVVGDVSGKGLLAATRTAEVKYTLRTVLHDLLVKESVPDRAATLDDAAHRALDRVNQTLAHELREGGVRTGGSLEAALALPTFVCLTVALLNPATGDCALAVAGMEPPILLRRRADDIVGEVLAAGGLPIGVLPDADYESLAFHLDAGESLLLATDGLTESRRKGSPALFGVDGLCRAAEDAFASPPSGDSGDGLPDSLNERAAKIVAAAKVFAGEKTLKDDACVLLVRRR